MSMEETNFQKMNIGLVNNLNSTFEAKYYTENNSRNPSLKNT